MWDPQQLPPDAEPQQADFGTFHHAFLKRFGSPCGPLRSWSADLGLQVEAHLRRGTLQGPLRATDWTGRTTLECFFHDGRLHGPLRRFEGTRVLADGWMHLGQPVGNWTVPHRAALLKSLDGELRIEILQSLALPSWMHRFLSGVTRLGALGVPARRPERVLTLVA